MALAKPWLTFIESYTVDTSKRTALDLLLNHLLQGEGQLDINPNSYNSFGLFLDTITPELITPFFTGDTEDPYKLFTDHLAVGLITQIQSTSEEVLKRSTNLDSETENNLEAWESFFSGFEPDLQDGIIEFIKSRRKEKFEETKVLELKNISSLVSEGGEDLSALLNGLDATHPLKIALASQIITAARIFYESIIRAGSFKILVHYTDSYNPVKNQKIDVKMTELTLLSGAQSIDSPQGSVITNEAGYAIVNYSFLEENDADTPIEIDIRFINSDTSETITTISIPTALTSTTGGFDGPKELRKIDFGEEPSTSPESSRGLADVMSDLGFTTGEVSDVDSFIINLGVEWEPPTLRNIRNIGGFQNTSSFEAQNIGLQNLLKVLDKQAFLEGMNVENDLAIHVAPKSESLDLERLSSLPRSKSVSLIKQEDNYNDFRAYIENARITSGINFAASFIAGELSNGAMGFNKTNSSSPAGTSTNPDTRTQIHTLLNQIYEEHCACKDCETAISPLAYLLDLLNYTVNYVEQGSSPSTALNLSLIEDRFHQQYDRLPAICKSVNESVSQARMSIEVLRIKNEESSTPETYLMALYNSVLQLLGTSLLEVSDAFENEELKQKLANKIGLYRDLDFDIISNLKLPTDPMFNESDLERLIGFKDTRVFLTDIDSFSEGLKTGDSNSVITQWNFDNLNYGVNTNIDGTIVLHLTYTPSPKKNEIEVKLNGGKVVGKGSIDDNTGNLAIVPEGSTGLSGVVHLLGASASDTITIHVFPEILAAQLKGISQKWQAIDDETLPIIDPDILSPSDFLNPYEGSAIQEWKTRKSQLSAHKSALIQGSRTYSTDTFIWQKKIDSGEIQTESSPPVLHSIQGICKDSQGNIYLANFNSSTPETSIIKLDKDLLLLDEWTQVGGGISVEKIVKLNFSSEWNLLAFANNNTGNNEIFLCSPENALKIRVKLEGETAGDIGSMNAPRNVQMLPSGDIIYSDLDGSSDYRLQKIDRPQLISSIQSGNAITAMDDDGDKKIAFLRAEDNKVYFENRYPSLPGLETVVSNSSNRTSSPATSTSTNNYSHSGTVYTLKNPVDLSFSHDKLLFVLEDTEDFKGVIVYDNSGSFLGSFKCNPSDFGSAENALLSVAVSKKDGDKFIYISYLDGLNDNKIRVNKYDYDFDTFALSSLSEIIGLSDNLVFTSGGKLICDLIGDLYLSYGNNIGKYNGTFDDNFIVSGYNDLNWLSLKLKGSGNPVVYSSTHIVAKSNSGIIEEYKISSQQKTGHWESHSNDWLNMSASGGMCSNIDGHMILSGMNGTAYRMTAPKLFWQPSSQNDISDVFFGTDKKLWVAVPEDTKLYRLSVKNGNEELIINDADLKALSICEDEYNNLVTLSESSGHFHIHRFRKNGSEIENVNITTTLSITNGQCFEIIPGGKGLLTRSSSPKLSFVNVKTRVENLLETYETDVAQSPFLLPDSPIDFASFLELGEAEKMGTDIEKMLNQHFMSFSEYRFLVNIYQRDLESPNSVNDSDWWDQAKDILVNVTKKAKAQDWKAEEISAEIFVSPEIFKPVSKVQEGEINFNRWRSSLTARLDYSDKIASRTRQKQDAIDANSKLIMDLEANHLPALRDYLIDLDSDSAQTLENSLLIDMFGKGTIRSNRITQATTTLQGFIWGIQQGFYENENGLNVNSDYFETEWQWLSTYANWRSAMMVFLYPENLLAPQYKKLFSPDFKSLTIDVLKQRRFTSKSACQKALELQEAHKTIGRMQVIESIICNVTLNNNSEECEKDVSDGVPEIRNMMIGGDSSMGYYYALHHPVEPKADKYSLWKKIPLEEVHKMNYVGLVTNYDYDNGSLVFIFSSKNEKFDLVGLTFNPTTTKWGENFIEIPELPKVISFLETPIKDSVKSRYSSIGKIVSFSERRSAIFYSKTNSYNWVSTSNSNALKVQSDYYRLTNYKNNLKWIHLKTLSENTNLNDISNIISLHQPRFFIEDVSYGVFYISRPQEGEGRQRIIFLNDQNLSGTINRAIEKTEFGTGFSDLLGIKAISKIEGGNSILYFILYSSNFNTSNSWVNETVVKFDGDNFSQSYNTNSEIHPWWLQSTINFTDKNEIEVDKDVSNIIAYHNGQINYTYIDIVDNKVIYNHSRKVSPKTTSDVNIVKSATAKPTVNDILNFENLNSYELFYLEESHQHFPLLMAEKLRESGDFESALKWYDQIYNRKLQSSVYKGLEFNTLDSEYIKGDTWLLDPLDPHGLAKTRSYAYLKYISTGIAKCLISYGDSEYAKDTAESVSKARELYSEALDTLSEIMDLDPEVDCRDLVEGVTITVDSTLSEWQPLVNTIIGLLYLVNDRSQLSSFISGSTGLVDSIEDATTESILQNAIETYEQAVLDEVYQYSGIHQITISDQTANVAVVFDRLITAGMMADDVVAAGRLAGNNGKQLAKEALQHAVGLPEASFTAAKSNEEANWDRNGLEVNWLSSEAYHRVGSYTSDKSILNLVKDANMDETFYNDRVGRSINSEDSTESIEVLNNPMRVIANGGGLRATSYQPRASFLYCIPRNPLADYLALTAQLNLFKIRDGRNISGYERELEAFSVATDGTTGLPGLSGNGGSQLSNLGYSTVPYRFDFLIQKAKEQGNYAAQMEQGFLNLLEKFDAENYSLLLARQGLNLSSETVRLQDLRLRESNQNLELSNKQLEQITFRRDHYKNLLDQGMIGSELASIYQLENAQIFTALASSLQSVGLLANLTVVDTKLTATVRAGNLFLAASALAAGGASLSQLQSSILSQKASYERRSQEWQFQEGLANFDIELGNQSIKIANTRVDISSQEKRISELQKQHSTEVLNFLKNKFTNAELYAWMIGIMEGVYSYFLAQTTSTAKLAYKQLAFERQSEPSVNIQDDYWGSEEEFSGLSSGLSSDGPIADRRGLTGSSRLLQDIVRLEQEAIETDERRLQISKTISLSTLDPSSFVKFQRTGILNFSTPMEIFDRDFPGHTMRLIKSVDINLIALIPTVEGVNASLSSLPSSSIVAGDIQPEAREIRRLSEKMIFNGARGENGVFQLQQNPNIYNAFEGMGVAASWIFEMQKPSNFLDYNSIADILITINYTAIDNSNYRSQIIEELGQRFQGERPFSFKNNFPDQWYDLNNADLFLVEDQLKVKFNLRPIDFPPNISRISIEQIGLAVRLKEKLVSTPYEFEISINQNICMTNEQRISTRTNGTPWTGLKQPIQDSLEWNFEILSAKDSSDLKITGDQLFKLIEEEIDDIYLFISYAGTTSNWS